MSKTNLKPGDRRVDPVVRLAGGGGALAAVQDAAGLLRRAVLANLLWEDTHYEKGAAGAENIRTLVTQVAPETCAEIALEARLRQKLRHVPLFIAREMARYPTHRGQVSRLLSQIIQRADELAEFLALYWQDGRQPLSKQVKKGLAEAFPKFDAYQLAKYNRDGVVKLRDVLFMTHAKPKDDAQAETWKALVNGTLAAPDTWEVALSSGADKKATWERLIAENKLGALAFLRNLRNMEEAKVDPALIRTGLAALSGKWLLPLNFLAAARHAPRYERELEALMLQAVVQVPKLPGYSIFILDVSGSMSSPLSEKSQFNRLEVGAAMAMLALEVCERVTLYVTAGSDHAREHRTRLLPPRRGFGLLDAVKSAYNALGGGGIFTRQCLEYIRTQEQETPTRIMIFSDSQDCDWPDRRLPAPFGQYNYIVDVSSHARGLNYAGLWTAEIAGWSEHFLTYVAALEGLPVQEQADE